MCGRFGATFTFREIMVRWNLQRDFPLYVPRFNIAPSQQVPVIVRTHQASDAKPMQWGLVPWWAKDPAIGNRMINARAETLTGKGAFKNLVDRRRCDGREIILTRTTQPEPELKLLLDKLRLELPPQSPPKISTAQTTSATAL
jgi:hypothetical protein